MEITLNVHEIGKLADYLNKAARQISSATSELHIMIDDLIRKLDKVERITDLESYQKLVEAKELLRL